MMKGPRYRWRIIVLLGALVFVGFVATPGEAHWADLAVAEIAIGESKMEMTLVFPTGLLRSADDNRDGQLSAGEVRAHRARLATVLGDRIRVTDGDEAAVLSVAAVESPVTRKNLNITPGTHSTLSLTYTWPRPVRSVTIRYGLFEPGVSTASCLATILQDGKVRSFVFTPENREFSVTLGRQAIWNQAWSFLVLGIEHIMTGYDHLLFLLSLLMVGGGLRYLVKVVSAFTVAHSITLSLAVLNVVSLPSRWVESAIALSIVYIAAENVWRKERALGSRWVVTFAFGLVHGLGFASILREFAIPRSDLVLSLVSFNLGVEVGQIAVVTAAFVFLQILSRVVRGPLEARFRRLVSAGAVAMGLVWFVQRAFLS
ncbi:MAG: HupE/UreJ family protein [Armatimonadota bacterium]